MKDQDFELLIANISLHITGFLTIQVTVKNNAGILWKGSLPVKCNGTQFERLFKVDYWDAPRKLVGIFPEAIQFFNEMDSRLDRYNSTSIVEPLMFPEGEFIEVDQHSFFYGNYKLGGKEGCCATIIEDEKSDLTLNVFDPRLHWHWSSHVLPRSIQEEIEGDAAVPYYNVIYRWSNHQKREFFEKLPVQVRRDLVEQQLSNLKVDIQMNKPFSVQLSGNDDASWTKYFDTHQECLDELTYLRKMQPINKEMDVINRGYIFTN